MSGTSTPTTSVAITGNLSLDALLYGAKWASSSITYSNPDSATDYQSGYHTDQDGDGTSAQYEGFSQLNAAQMKAMHFALNTAPSGTPTASAGFAVEGFTNLQIDYAGAGTGAATIRGANSSDAATAYGFYPSSSVYAGDTFFGAGYSTLQTPDTGNFGWYTMLHELGHTLGLKHPHEGSYTLPSSQDSIEFTVMSYRDHVGDADDGMGFSTYSGPQTYMMLDIYALQHMYGANYSVNSGNTTYTWNPVDGTTYVNGTIAIDPGGNTIFCTIWDGGGSDTYDLSNYTSNCTINLAPGAWSTFSSSQLAFLEAFQAIGNVANALLFNGDTRSLIEHAKGGSGNDIIKGNVGNNQLFGNEAGLAQHMLELAREFPDLTLRVV